MYCRHCGRELSSNSKFCDICGTAIEINNSIAEEFLKEENLVKNKQQSKLPLLAVCFVVLLAGTFILNFDILINHLNGMKTKGDNLGTLDTIEEETENQEEVEETDQYGEKETEVEVDIQKIVDETVAEIENLIFQGNIKDIRNIIDKTVEMTGEQQEFREILDCLDGKIVTIEEMQTQTNHCIEEPWENGYKIVKYINSENIEIGQINYSAEDMISMIWCHRVNEKGDFTAATLYNPDGIMEQNNTYYNNLNGETILWLTFDKNNTLVNYYTYKFDDNGEIYQYIKYSSDGKIEEINDV